MAEIIDRLEAVIEDRRRNPNPQSYVCKLLSSGEDVILRKLGEEAIETLLAAKCESDERLVSEATDMVFHLMVLMGSRRIPMKKIYDELEARFGKVHGAK